MHRGLPDRASAAQALTENQENPQNWHDFGLALAAQGDGPALLSLAEVAAARFGDAVIFFHNVVKDLALRQHWDLIDALMATVGPDRREAAVLFYYRGCADVAAGRESASLDWFARFRQAVLPRHKQFPLTSDDAFNLIFRQGALVDPVELTRQALAQPLPPVPGPTFHGRAAGGQGDFVLAHVLDRRYFLRFAESLCAAHVQAGMTRTVHFHVVSADDTTLAEIARLRAAHDGLVLGFSTEPVGSWDHPVYYTCARFFVVPALLDHYGRDVMCVDADIVLNLDPARIHAAARDAGFACFRTGRQEPASAYQASVMIFCRDHGGALFAGDLARFCAAKLGWPPILGWMLDQAALYSVLAQRRQDAPDFRFIALDQALGLGLEECTVQLSSQAEKHSLMTGGAC